MKVVILAGGFGTRISEESHLRPKDWFTSNFNHRLWFQYRFFADPAAFSAR